MAVWAEVEVQEVEEVAAAQAVVVLEGELVGVWEKISF
jgi:hypothetical protein